MSTAILRENGNGTVSAAWDSQLTIGGHARVILTDDKVFMNGNLLFAVAGTLKGLLAVKHGKFSPYRPKDKMDDYVWGSLMPELRKALTDAGEQMADAEEGDPFELDLVVGINGVLYDLSGVQNYFRRMDGLYTVGSGGEYARGAATAWADLRQAVEVAKSNDTLTGGDVREGTFSW